MLVKGSDIIENIEIQKNINNIMNSKSFNKLLKDLWNDNHNLNLISKLIGEVYLHNIIHKDGYGFEYYIKNIKTMYYRLNNKEISPSYFEKEKSKLISIVIAKKLNIEYENNITDDDIKKIKDYFVKEFINKGFVAHSFIESFKDSIQTFGLSSENRNWDDNEILKIANLFNDKGIPGALGGYMHYNGKGVYFENDYSKILNHGINSPEWFNFFTSSNHTQGFPKIEDSPFSLRNYNACNQNVYDLCLNTGLSHEETFNIINFFNKYYKAFESPNINVALIPKNLIMKDTVPECLQDNINLFDFITNTLKDSDGEYQEHIGNVYQGSIKIEDLVITNLPKLNEIININKFNRETKSQLLDQNTNKEIYDRINELNKMKDNVIKDSNDGLQQNTQETKMR